DCVYRGRGMVLFCGDVGSCIYILRVLVQHTPKFFLSPCRGARLTPLFPYTTLFRSRIRNASNRRLRTGAGRPASCRARFAATARDRKSTRLNSSHVSTSYAVFRLKKKTSPAHTPGDKAARRPGRARDSNRAVRAPGA